MAQESCYVFAVNGQVWLIIGAIGQHDRIFDMSEIAGDDSARRHFIGFTAVVIAD